MSAYVVSKAHIDALVSAAMQLGGGPGTPRLDFWWPDRGRVDVTLDTATEIGRMLWATNHESVNYRYSENEPAPEYAFVKTREFSDAEIRDLVAGYDYQSCEHPGWRDSPAWYFCERVRHRLLDRIPGLSNCWAVDVADVGYGTAPISLTDLIRGS